jgi:hypothetical protein
VGREARRFCALVLNETYLRSLRSLAWLSLNNQKQKTGPHKARITIRVMLLLHHSRVNGPCQTHSKKRVVVRHSDAGLTPGLWLVWVQGIVLCTWNMQLCPGMGCLRAAVFLHGETPRGHRVYPLTQVASIKGGVICVGAISSYISCM